MESEKTVLFEKRGNIAVITINRPKALNALNFESLMELVYIIESLEKDDSVLAVIITGIGEKAFVAGADITEIKDMNSAQARKFSQFGNRYLRRMELLDKPVLAAINGFALGGGLELALACDIRIASTKAKFGLPETGLGVIPGFGGTQRLPRIVGLAIAKELIFSGRTITAEEAYRIGLVNRVVELDQLMAETMSLAITIANQIPAAVKFSKVAMNRGVQCDLDTALMYEVEIFAQCFGTDEQKQKMTAFIEKKLF